MKKKLSFAVLLSILALPLWQTVPANAASNRAVVSPVSRTPTAITVVSKTPAVNQLDAAADSNIMATFNTDINAATVNVNTFNVDGSLSGKIAGSYSTVGAAVTFSPAVNFKTGEMVTVTLTTGIQGTTGMTLVAPVTWQFTVDVPYGLAAFSAGVNFGASNASLRSVRLADMDGDGDLDLVIGPYSIYKNNGSGSVWTQSGTGTDSSSSTAIGDMNGDGYLDIVVGNFLGQNAVYLNDGTGTNWTHTNFGPEHDGTYSVALGDVDGDGDLDIVVGNHDTYTRFDEIAAPNAWNEIYLNNGTGTAWTSINLGTGNDRTGSISLGDMDGDGDLDIAVGNDGRQSAVYLNNGNGTQWTAVNFGTGSDWPASMALGDVDGDGYLDIVLGNYGQQGAIYLNNGAAAVWTSVSFGLSANSNSVALGDMDADGDLDIVQGNSGQQNVIYRNNGTGTGWSGVNFGTGSDSTMSVTLGDLDGDGDLDIAVGNYGQSAVYKNNNPEIRIEGNSIEIVSGDTTPSASDYTDFSSTPVDGGTVDKTYTIKNTGDAALTLSDTPKVNLSGSNAADFSVTLQPASPIAAGGQTTFTLRFNPSVSGLRTAVVSIVNDDANEDPYTFAIQGTGRVITLISFTPSVNQPDVADGSDIVVTFSADIDSATIGAATFIVSGSLSGRIVGAYSTNGAVVTFSPAVSYKAGETITVTLTTGIRSTTGGACPIPMTWQFMVEVPGGLAVFPSGVNLGAGNVSTQAVAFGDVDSDGDLDIVVGNYGGQNMVYKNDGTGTVWTAVTFGTGSESTISIALGDVDGDGHLDIVVGNYGEQSVVYKNDGTGTTWTGVYFGTSADRTVSVALGDVDGDGDLDIAAGNFSQRSIVYKNDGTGTTWTGVNFGAEGCKPYSIALGDLDNDGDLDIVVGNYGGQNTIYKNDGTGVNWTAFSFGPIGSDATRSVALGDVDGDGDLDIVVGNYEDIDHPVGDHAAQNVVYKNDGTGGTLTAVSFGPSGNRTLSVALGDLDGDGDLDIVSQNSGQNVVYKNNGAGTVWTCVNFGTGYMAKSVALGDIDGDGDLDIATVNGIQNLIYRNSGHRMAVLGNSSEINNGDTTPSASDHTDFGGAAVSGGSVDRVFTILNNGDVPLILSGTPRVILSGANAADFTITVPPASPVAAGNQTTFTVRFHPSASGLRAAAISIANNDNAVNPFTFAIQGNGGVITVVPAIPTSTRLNVPANTDIAATFSANVNGATVNTDTFNVDGSLSGRIAGTYTTSGATVTFNPARDFKPGETVTVTLTTGIRSTTGSALATPETWQFTVKVPGGLATFPSSVNFGTNSDWTRSVALGDVNGDGHLDIVVGRSQQQSVIYLNDSTGANWTAVSFGKATDTPYSIALGDVDSDGDLDIAVGNWGGQNVVYLNDGTGTLWTGVNFGTGTDVTYSVALGDVDNDGDVDIAVGNYNEQSVVYKNEGTGTVWTGVNLGIGIYFTCSVALGDVDGDGDLDVVTGNEGGQHGVVYKNDGTGTTWTAIEFGTGYAVALGDVDSDGDLDIVVGNCGGQNVVYKNDGTGTTWMPIYSSLSSNNVTLSVALGDMDGDGALDTATGSSGKQNVVYKNDGTGNACAGINFGPGNDTTCSIALGDVDNDGDLDIVVGNYRQQSVVYRNGSSEIRIEGNSTEIVNGDTTPNTGDFTDFGSTAVVGGIINRTFAIKNTGDATLALSGTLSVSLSGVDAVDFSVVLQPASPLAPGGQTIFTVRFDPSAVGLRVATVSIANNDSNENPYTFTVQGTGVQFYALNIVTNGNGTTDPVVGTHDYPAGTEVTVTADPDPGWVFSHWSGDASGSTIHLDITMDGSKNITANFAPEGYTLVGAIRQNPAAYTGLAVKLSGSYRGWEPGHGLPPVSKSDWVLQDTTGSLYVSGNSMGLDYAADIGKPVVVTGIIKLKDGHPYMEVSRTGRR